MYLPHFNFLQHVLVLYYFIILVLIHVLLFLALLLTTSRVLFPFCVQTIPPSCDFIHLLVLTRPYADGIVFGVIVFFHNVGLLMCVYSEERKCLITKCSKAEKVIRRGTIIKHRSSSHTLMYSVIIYTFSTLSYFLSCAILRRNMSLAPPCSPLSTFLVSQHTMVPPRLYISIVSTSLLDKSSRHAHYYVRLARSLHHGGVQG